MKNKLKATLITILVILIIAIGILEVKDYLKPTNNTKVEVKEFISIGPYKISTNQTTYLKEIGEKLKTAYNANPDDKNTVNALVSYFVADYFTLRNKFVMDDIGGMGLVFPKISKVFKENAIDSYYMDLTEYRNEYGPDNLPEVNSVVASKAKKVDKASVELKKSIKQDVKEFRDVKVSWTYLDNEIVNPTKLKIVNKCVVRIVKDKDDNWWIYEILG